MVIKGRARTNGVQLACYLLDAERNEEIAVLGIMHPDRDNLHTALADMQDMTDTGQRGTKGLYHAQVSPAMDYEMSKEQWLDCANVLAQELGLEQQPHAMVLHEKKGRTHLHVVWQRTDAEKLTLISDSMNYAAHERASRTLEKMFGHEHVEGVHTGKAERGNSDSKAKVQQGERSTLDPRARKEQITALWKQCDGGKAFTAALNEEGYILAKGDKRGLVIVDEAGEIHSLARQIKGVKKKELEGELDHIDKNKLPNVTDALALQMQEKEEKFEELNPEQETKQAEQDEAEKEELQREAEEAKEAAIQKEIEKKQAAEKTGRKMDGPRVHGRDQETPDEKEKRLRALTKNVLYMLNQKIKEVTKESKLYQSASRAIGQVKEKLTGFMREHGIIAPQKEPVKIPEVEKVVQREVTKEVQKLKEPENKKPEQEKEKEKPKERETSSKEKSKKREKSDWREEKKRRDAALRRERKETREERKQAYKEGRGEEYDREAKRRAIEKSLERAKNRENENER